MPFAQIRPPEPAHARVPPQERREQRAAAETADVVRGALAWLEHGEAHGDVPEGTVDVVRQALAAGQAESERHQRTKEQLERTEKRLSEVVAERHRIERELRAQLRPLGGTRTQPRLGLWLCVS